MTKYIRYAAYGVLAIAFLLIGGIADTIYIDSIHNTGFDSHMKNLDVLLSTPMLIAIAVSSIVLKFLKEQK